MDDLALAAFLCPDDVETGQAIVRKLSPSKRAGYERLAEVAASIERGIVPPGVMVD